MQLIYFSYNHGILPPAIPKISLSYCELTFVLKGTVVYWIDGEAYPIQSGEAVFLPEGRIRERKKAENKATYVSFNFTSEEAPHLPLVIKEALCAESNLLLACADEIRQKYYPNGEKQLECICACLVENLQARCKLSKEHTLIAKIKNYINTHLTEKITLQKIGELTYFSPLYCDVVFKRETGTSIINYVIERRMDEAKKLLSQGNLSLKGVAEAVGFEDYNYFSRTFKKWKGVTPREYRTSFTSP